MSAPRAGCAAIVTAAGSGNRLGAGIPKALVEVGGQPMLAYAVASMALAGIPTIIVTAPADQLAAFEAVVADEQLQAAAARAWPALGHPPSIEVRIAAGGASRQASVAAGLEVLAEMERPDVILVHDAARPLTPPEMIARLADAVSEEQGAVIPGLAVADTLKRVDDDGFVTGIIERADLRAIQTPQAFRADLLARAHAYGAGRASDEALAATDDAGLVEAMGEAVRVIEGDAAARKITTAADLAALELRLAALG